MGTSDHSSGDRRPRGDRQDVVAELGDRALDVDDVDGFLYDASVAVRDVLAADAVAVLEVQGGAERALVRHRVGRDDGNGTATLPLGPDTGAGRALDSGEPDVTEDGISVVVGPADEPWGVLSVHAGDGRTFGRRDVTFVRCVANALASAVDDGANRARLESEPEATLDRITDAFFALDEEWTVTYVNDRAVELIDPEGRGLVGENFWEAFPEAVGTTFEAAYRTAMERQEPATFEEYYPPLETWFEVNAYPSASGLSVYFRDVTERKQREQQLEQYRALTAAASDVIVTIDADSTIRSVNPAVEDVFGYPRDELEGEPLTRLMPEEFAERHRAGIRNYLETGERTIDWEYVELPGERADGTRIPLAVSFSEIEYEGERYFTGIVRDVTERKAMEAQLEENNRTLQRLYAVSADQDRSFDEKVEGILELGRERLGVDVGFLAETDEAADRFEVVHASGDDDRLEAGAVAPLSDTYCRRTIDADELLVVENAPDEGWADDHAYRKWDYDCYLGGTVRVDGERYGTLCFVSTSPRPSEFTESERAFVELVTQWVSYELERRRREQRLERYREYTDDVLDAVDDVFYVLDERGTLRRWNETLPDVTGYDDAEVDSMHALEFFEEGDRDSIARAIRDGFESGRAQVRADVLTNDGETIPYEFVASVLEDPAGDPVLAGIGRDVTERERNRRKIERTVAKLEASNERLEQFAYAASHDLQEPLRMVSSYLGLLEERYGDALDEDGEEFLAFALDGADRMREMIEGLLEYSRIDTQGEPMEPVDLEAVFAEAKANLQLQIAETDAEITAEPLPAVVGDAGQLRQLFQNLLSNAIEYTEEGAPRIRVTAERREVRSTSERSSAERSSAGHSSGLRGGESASNGTAKPSPGPREDASAAETDGSQWRIAVSDEGIGMDPDETDRIFDVFDRLHSRADHDGTGIGLAICQRIVERHGGEIRVDSDPGEGSTFYFTLPTTDGTHD